MKKATFLLLIIAICFGYTAQSQDTLRLFGHQRTQHTAKREFVPNSQRSSDIQTLTGPGHSTGFYMGFHSEYSQVEGYDAIGFGGTIAVIANHGLAIGLSGRGFVSEPFDQLPESKISYNYAGGYGGILIEPILFPKSAIHVAFPILLGAGGIAKSVLTNYNYPYDYTDVNIDNADAFFIAEPGIELECNVSRWMRLGLGASYRFTTTVDQSYFSSNPLNSFTAGFSMKFGKF